MIERRGLAHRTFTGWISDFSSLPRWEPWPSITLDRRLMVDLFTAFEKAQIAGYNEVILWGLLCGRSWSPYLPDTVGEARKARVLEVMAEARRRRLKVLMGLGVYSWGFEEIIRRHPEVDGGSSRAAMCGTRPESRAWMERTIDYIMGEYDPDGLSMQSSDLGRCACDACQEMGAVEYHALVNDRTAAYVRSRWPDKLIQISTWGLDLGDAGDLPHVQQMTAHVDVLNDQSNSAGRSAPGYRRTLIEALDCAYGTEGGWYVDPPPFWDRAKWFLPLSVRNAPYFGDLHADGGDAVERFILPLVNPGAEVGFLFDGMMLSDVHRDPLATLGQALDMAFEPRTTAAREALVAVWQRVENAFLDHCRCGQYPQPIHLSTVHYNALPPDARLSERPQHLLRMKPASVAAYADALRSAQQVVRDVRGDLGDGEKAARLKRAIGVALAEAEWVLAVKAPL